MTPYFKCYIRFNNLTQMCEEEDMAGFLETASQDKSKLDYKI